MNATNVTKTVRLKCAQCGTEWDRKAQRGRKPKLCDSCRAAIPAPEPSTGQRELFCNNGQHKWMRDNQRGKTPKNCPEHPDAKPEPKRTERKSSSRAKVIAEVKARYSRCSCDLPDDITNEELIKLGAGCCAPSYVCPSLVAIRNALYDYGAHNKNEETDE